MKRLKLLLIFTNYHYLQIYNFPQCELWLVQSKWYFHGHWTTKECWGGINCLHKWEINTRVLTCVIVLCLNNQAHVIMVYILQLVRSKFYSNFYNRYILSFSHTHTQLVFNQFLLHFLVFLKFPFFFILLELILC